MGIYLPSAFNDNAPSGRQHIERAIEHLIAILDDMDGDADLELGADDEPILGWIEWSGRGWSARDGCSTDDREEDAGDEVEPDEDREPALGWTGHVDQSSSRRHGEGWRWGEDEEDGPPCAV